MDSALAQRERNLFKYNNVYAIPDQVTATNFPGVHISNFYFSFNDDFSRKFGSYRNVINLAKTDAELIAEYKLPFFVFKFHNKHFLISAKPLRNELIGPIKKREGCLDVQYRVSQHPGFYERFSAKREAERASI